MSSKQKGHRAARSTAQPPTTGVDRRWVIGALGAGAVAAVGGWYLWPSARSARAGNHPHWERGMALPVTLSPALFVGKAAAAYQVAREIPETLAQIYCYCRCDQTVGHRSLVDCFSDAHGSG